MTAVEEIKALRDELSDKLNYAIVPLIEEFEAKTGVVANVRTRRLNVTTLGMKRAAWKVTIEVDLDWEA